MFFLLRCVFWLGLVFLHLDWRGEAPSLPSPERLWREAGGRCVADPKLCLELASKAPKVAAHFEAKPLPLPAPRAVPAKP